MTKKIFAMFLAVLMVVSMLPTTVFAADCTVKGQHTKGNCDWTLVKVNDPTCGAVGYTTYQCNDCKELFIDDIVPATGEHEFEEVEAEAPTCEKTGKTAGLQCKYCDASEGREVIPALFKDRKCEWVDITPNIDCTTGGQKWDECAHCGAQRKNGQPLQPGKHTWDNNNPEIVKEATATESGLAIVSCLGCNAEKEVEVFAVHDCVMDYVPTVWNTCETDGFYSHYACRICGTMYGKYNGEYYELDEYDIADKVIPAQHAFVEMGDKAAAIKAIKDKDSDTLSDLLKKCKPDCTDTVLYCVYCEKDLPAGVEHSFSPYYYDEDNYVAPTCTNSGYIVYICYECHLEKDVHILEATGHHEVTVEVPATCGGYGYTLTYCTSPNCDAGEYSVDENIGFNTEIRDDEYTPYSVLFNQYVPYADIYKTDDEGNVVTEPVLDDENNPVVDDEGNPVTRPVIETKALELVKARMNAGKGFYLALNQTKVGTPLYFTGEMDGYYLATSNDVSEAVVVYVEHLQYYRDLYNLYFYDAEGVKTYIEIYEYEAFKGGVRLTTEAPENNYVWDAEYNTFTCTIESTVRESTTYYLGTYKSYTTFSVSNYGYIATSMPAQLAYIGVKGGVQITNVEFDYEAGYDKDEHANLEEVVTVMPSCTEDGVMQITCTCGLLEEEVIPAGCVNAYLCGAGNLTLAKPEDLAAEKIKGDVVAAPTCTTAGYQWLICTECDELIKNPTAPALGHNMLDYVVVTPSHTQLVGYQGIKCTDCDFVWKYNVQTWYFKNYHFASESDAAAQHGHFKAQYDDEGNFVCWLTENDNPITIVKNADGTDKHWIADDWKTPRKPSAGWSLFGEVPGTKAVAGYVSDLVYVKNLRQGTCTTYGLDAYKCTVCGNQVLVKTADELGLTGQHIAPETLDNLKATVGANFVPTRSGYFTLDIDDGVTVTIYEKVKVENEDGTTGTKWVVLYEEVDNAKIVELKKDGIYDISNNDLKGEEVELVQVPYYVAPTCETNGYLITYTCVRCEKVVGNAAEGKMNTIKAHGHNWLEGYNSIYMAADCENPDFDPDGDNWKYWCSYCNNVKSDGTKLLNDKKDAVCGSNAFMYYICHCGEEHIRNYINLEHSYYTVAPSEDPNYVEATCYSTGKQTVYCEYCTLAEVVDTPTVPHVNADEEEFTDKCTDTETDRHCVVCCKHFNHAAKGNKHDCYETDKYGNFKCAGQCQIGKDHHVTKEGYEYYDSNCTTNPYGIGICADCDTHLNVYFEKDSEGNKIQQPTHTPVEAEYVLDETTGEKIYTKYANYTYVWFTPVSYVVVDSVDEDGNPIKVAQKVTGEKYLAQYNKFTAPTYAADGYAECVCTVCSKNNEVFAQTLNKLEGIGFYMDIKNANGDKEIGYGSLVEVTVSIEGFEAFINAFNFNVTVPEGFIYVGSENLTTDFAVSVTQPINFLQTGALVIDGVAENNASGKVQNIELTGKIEMVKLFFRNTNMDGAEDITIELLPNKIFNGTEMVAEDGAVALINNKVVAIDCNFSDVEFDTRSFMDFNKNGVASREDLYLAMTLVTGEQPDGKTYDVTVDMNKDGVVTMEDLSIAYAYFTGDVDEDDLLYIGMSDAEFEFFMVYEGAYAHKCQSPFCSYAQGVEFDYCPACGYKQNHEEKK